MPAGSSAVLPTSGAAARPLGRPRDPRVDAAIVDATLRLLAESGYTALTMESVAALAGVGKATLYRRYPGKEQLVVDAMATLAEPPELVQGAGVRDELVARLDAVRRRRGSLAARIFPRLLSASIDNPELMRAYERQVTAPRRAAFKATLQRGVDEGLVRPEIDLDYAVDLLIGPVAYRNLVHDRPAGPELAEDVVDDVLAALAPRTGAGRRPRTDRPRPAPADRTTARPAPQEDPA